MSGIFGVQTFWRQNVWAKLGDRRLGDVRVRLRLGLESVTETSLAQNDLSPKVLAAALCACLSRGKKTFNTVHASVRHSSETCKND